MDIVNGIESALQHSEKTEVEQTREPSDDSNESSGDSTNASSDCPETSGGSGKLSNDGSGQSGGDSHPSDDSSASQQTSEISTSELSESENSSAESSKKEQRRQSGKLLNQMRNDNISNIEEFSINKTNSADQWLPDILNSTGENVDSSLTGVDGCGKFPMDSVNNNNFTSETLFDVSKSTLESSLEGGKNDGGSDPSFSSDNSEIKRFNLTRKSLTSMYANLHCSKSSTSNQDRSSSINQVDSNNKTSVNQTDANFKKSMYQGEDNNCTSVNDAEKNINNSSLRKRSGGRVSKSISNSGHEPQSLWICTMFIVIPSVSVLIGLLCVWLHSSYISSKNDSSFDKFSAYVREIKQNFPSQNHKLWRTFEASTRRILMKDVSKYPAVILMASSKKHSSVTRCIARNISSAFDLSVGLSPGSSLIDFKDYKTLSPAEQKLQLDSTLNSALGNDKRKSFVLENLQFLDPLAAVLFYHYCDNDYAPFKDVLIILALYFDDEKEKIDDAEAVENYLEMIWNKGLDIDKVKPLLSRVANHIVIVQGEGQEILNNRCL